MPFSRIHHVSWNNNNNLFDFEPKKEIICLCMEINKGEHFHKSVFLQHNNTRGSPELGDENSGERKRKETHEIREHVSL